MKNMQKHITANLLNANVANSFTLLVLTAFWAACSTPTVSSDDSDDGINSLSSAELKESFFNPDIDYGSMTDSRDGLVYRTVEIGEQTWMAENLNYETDNAYCYEDNAGNCTKYGRLYMWDAAAFACPNGWHLPTNSEFETLFNTVGGRSVAGRVLKSQVGWNSDGNGTDIFGFSAIPAGYRNGYGKSQYGGRTADFWGATENEDNSEHAYFVNISYSADNVTLGIHKKNLGCSVRCVKD